jgi:hypothetical protein
MVRTRGPSRAGRAAAAGISSAPPPPIKICRRAAAAAADKIIGAPPTNFSFFHFFQYNFGFTTAIYLFFNFNLPQ